MDEKIKEIEGYLAQLESMAPTIIDEKYKRMGNQIPFRVIVLRDGLIHRGVDLSKCALEMYKNIHMIPAIVLTRSIFESVSLIFFLHQKVEKFLSDRNQEELNAFLKRGTLGSKNNDTEYESINVLTAIDKLDKKYRGLREMYDALSEHSHPNWAGTFGSYIRLNEEKNSLILGPNDGSLSHMGLPPFVIALAVFIHYYERLLEIMPKLVEICSE
jgi:hypothetical protein